MAGTAESKQITDYKREVALLKGKGQLLTFLLLTAGLIILPYFLRWTGNINWLTFVNVTFITIIAVLGLNIITGMAGQVSMGHAAFVMVGAFTTGALIEGLNWPFWGALPAAALVTAVVGMIVGAPSLRLKGFYLAIATLAFFMIAQYIIRNLDITGKASGIMGINAPTIGSLEINTDTGWYYLITIFTVLFVLFSVNLGRSRSGRSFTSVRDNDTTAASLGIQAYSTKLRAFFIGSLFAGVAGGPLYGHITVIRLGPL